MTADCGFMLSISISNSARMSLALNVSKQQLHKYGWQRFAFEKKEKKKNKYNKKKKNKQAKQITIMFDISFITFFVVHFALKTLTQVKSIYIQSLIKFLVLSNSR